jgi:predicted nuclease of restriction endonuclease-like RecB superfamily
MKVKKTKNAFEERIYKALDKADVKVKYESEKIPYVLAGHYIPDFVITTPSGKVYIETKGYFRPEHKRKMAAVKRQHPELDIRILFYKYSLANARWAERYGFEYAFEHIPEEWILR